MFRVIFILLTKLVPFLYEVFIVNRSFKEYIKQNKLALLLLGLLIHVSFTLKVVRVEYANTQLEVDKLKIELIQASETIIDLSNRDNKVFDEILPIVKPTKETNIRKVPERPTPIPNYEIQKVVVRPNKKQDEVRDIIRERLK